MIETNRSSNGRVSSGVRSPVASGGACWAMAVVVMFCTLLADWIPDKIQFHASAVVQLVARVPVQIRPGITGAVSR